MDRSDFHHRIEDLQAIIKEKDGLIEALKIEYYLEKHREYDESAGACYENRRSLARQIARLLNASEEDTKAMVEYSHDARSPEGGYIIAFYFNILRERIAELEALIR